MKNRFRNFAGVVFVSALLAGCSQTAPPAPDERPETAAVAPAGKPAARVPTEPAPVPKAPAVRPRKAEAPRAAAPRPPAPAPVSVAPPTLAAPPAPEPVEPPAPPAPPVHVDDTREVTIPAGTEIAIRMIDSVDSGTDHVGQTFHASVDSDVMAGGDIVVPRRSDVYVKLTDVTAAGKLKGTSQLQLELDRIFVGKTSYVVESNVYEDSGTPQSQKAARNAGIGAAIGAALGAITGGAKGAVIGAGAGAGGGVGTTVLMKGAQVRVPSETRMVFTLAKPVDVEVSAVPASLNQTSPGPSKLRR